MPYRNTGLCRYTCHDLYTHGLYGQLFAAHWHSWECKGVLKAVDQFLEATFYQAVEQCALCTEVGFQVVPHRLGGFSAASNISL